MLRLAACVVIVSLAGAASAAAQSAAERGEAVFAAQINATRKPAMKEFSLPKDDVDALIAYLSSLEKK